MLAEDPTPKAKVKKQLKHMNGKLYRLRSGDYRIFYTFKSPYISLLALKLKNESTYSEDLDIEFLGGLDPDIEVLATCVRVPVFVGHGESVSLEFERPIRVDEAREALSQAPGVIVVDDREDGGYVTPIECVGEDAVYVSRIRQDPTVLNGLALWVVSDNLRKGAALNAVQIAEILVSDYLDGAARVAS